MKFLLTNIKVLDTLSSHHGKTVDILIEDGVITEIGKNLNAKTTYNLKGCVITPGFFDLFANFNEPGDEYKEDLQSGIECAIFGGFTDVCLIPNTNPVLESKSDVRFIVSHSSNGVDLHPIAAVSEGTNGENLTEILDLNSAGSIAFSDGLNPVWNTELLLKALQYVQKFDGLLVTRAKDIHLSQFSHMHEGVVSTALGLKGEPSISEELSLKRDLEVLKYAGGRIHFTNISTAKSVELISKAKKDGLNVTCDVAIHQLLYTEDDLHDFDSNLKVDPPFRTEKDRKALIKGLMTGVIDAICSSHQPQDTENKDLEFDLAAYGINAMPTVFSSLIQIQDELPLEIAVEKLTAGPRKIMGQEEVSIEVGKKAKLAIFDPKHRWTFDATTNPSKSENSPVFGKTLIGKCVGLINSDLIQKEKTAFENV